MSSLLAHSQLQRFGFGAKINTNDFSNNYSGADLIVQFNFKKHFSLLSGFGMEKTIHRSSEWFEFPMPSYTNSYVTTLRSVNIPLLFRTSFGNKALFYIDLGFQTTGFKSAESIVTESHSESSGIPDETYEKEHTFLKGNSGVVHGLFGAGLTFPATKHFMIFIDFHKNISLYESEFYVSGNTYFYGDAFNGARISLGITYQLRLPESEKYVFKPFLQEIFNKN